MALKKLKRTIATAVDIGRGPSHHRRQRLFKESVLAYPDWELGKGRCHAAIHPHLCDRITYGSVKFIFQKSDMDLMQ